MACGASHAQFSNTGSFSPSNSSSSSIGDLNTFYVQWNPSSFNSEGESMSFNGISLGFNHAFALSRTIPIYMETGIGAQYSFKTEKMKDDYGKAEDKLTFVSAKVPLNLAYKVDVPNSSFSIIPYAGLTGRLNISAKEKYKYNQKEETADLFDDDEVEETMKRFQLGWQIGINFKISSLVLGASYGADFSEIFEDVKIHTTSVTLGVSF